MPACKRCHAVLDTLLGAFPAGGTAALLAAAAGVGSFPCWLPSEVLVLGTRLTPLAPGLLLLLLRIEAVRSRAAAVLAVPAEGDAVPLAFCARTVFLRAPCASAKRCVALALACVGTATSSMAWITRSDACKFTHAW